MAAMPQRSQSFDEGSHLSEADSLYLAIVESTAPYTGDEFLHEITATVCRAIDVNTAFIIEFIDDLVRARALVSSHNGEFIPPFEFDLTQSSVAEALTYGKASHSGGIRQVFPPPWHQESQAEADACVVIPSRSGDPLGLLGVISETPMHEVGLIAAVLERLVPRVGAELERRQRELALRRSEARSRLLLEHSKDVMFYYRLQPDERFEYISPAVNDVVGFPPEAFFADAQLALEVLDPEYRPLVLRAMTTGSEQPIIARTAPGAGSAWVEYRNFAFRNDENSIIAIGGTIRDVSVRVQAQEDLAQAERYRRALLEAVPDTIFRLDMDGQVLDFVPGEALADALDDEAEGKRRNFGDLLPLAHVAPARRTVQDAIRTGQVQRFEFEITTGSEARTYEARCIPFGDREVLLILRDFTAMKWHAGEPARMRLRDELDVKVEDKMRVRNPYGLTYRELAVLHLVAEGSADKQIAEALGISIYTANKHVGNILGKMNAASRTEAGVRALREGLLG